MSTVEKMPWLVATSGYYRTFKNPVRIVSKGITLNGWMCRYSTELKNEPTYNGFCFMPDTAANRSKIERLRIPNMVWSIEKNLYDMTYLKVRVRNDYYEIGHLKPEGLIAFKRKAEV